MPIFDKPLPELKKYRGVNPRPADFDAYWRAALAALDATPPQAELIPNRTIQPRDAECFDLWFNGTAGARIYAKYLRPKPAAARKPAPRKPDAARHPAAAPRRHPALLLFHGYSGHSGDWADKLAYVSQGLCVAALDCRGQGGRSEDTGGVKGNTHRGQIIRGLGDPDPHKLLFRDLFLDTAQLARVVMAMPEVDPARVGATGGSQGGGLTLACAALEPRIKRAAPVFPFLCDYRRVWDMDLAKDAYEELRAYFRLFDPTHAREKEIFTKLGYIDCQHLAPRIKAEVLMATGLMDTICPPSTQFAAYNKIKSRKRMEIYPDFAHEHLPSHNDKIFEFMRGL